MRKLLTVALLSLLGAVGLVVAPISPAYACSCAMLSFDELVPRSTLVATGTVTSVEDPGGSASDRPVVYDVAIDEVYRGTPTTTAQVSSPASSASCGLELEEGRTYLLVAEGDGDPYRASLCGGTQPVTDPVLAQLEKVTGPPTAVTPAPGTTPSTALTPGTVAAPASLTPADASTAPGTMTYVLVGAALVLLAGGAWLVVRRRA